MSKEWITKKYHKEYRVWINMKSRCMNRNTPDWYLYGGRGIKICKRWMNFENFLSDMGKCPTKYSLDRIDTNGDYTPSNCRWATSKMQSRNTRYQHIVTIKGKSMPLVEAVENCGLLILYNTALQRIKRGWSVNEALSIPPIDAGKKRENL